MPSKFGSESAILGRQAITAPARDYFRQHRNQKPTDPAWKYVAAFAGSDIETNPPKTNQDVQNPAAPSRAR